ncbi:hypothetical protein OG824_31620 [Streptomyces prunicolor]|uniref:hypothetical protein n=1 Tax=Streptomyces prunicolor TaxID=67348 RepID=UPI002255B8DB|nr:hypothetical protein [Streptomyces prunicolor]MCX5239759.1 hypothetical protein [Streptomyces prunicolor]
MTPIEEIRTAAAKLQGLVQALGDNRGPWYIVNEQARHYPQTISNIGVPYCVASTTTDPSHEPTDAQYICAMHPGVGWALAKLLDQAAEALAGTEVSVDEPALLVARAVNYDHLQAKARYREDAARPAARAINDGGQQ